MADNEPGKAEAKAEAPAPSPEDNAGRRGPRWRRHGIVVSLLTAGVAGLAHAVGGPESALISGGVVAAGGGGMALWHLPRIRRHFNEGRREKTPRLPRAPRSGRERRAGPGRAAAGRSAPRGAGSRSVIPGGARRAGSPSRPGTVGPARARSGAARPSPGTRAGAGRATGRAGAGGAARGTGTGRRAGAVPRHGGAGRRLPFRRHGGTTPRAGAGGMGRKSGTPRAGSARRGGGAGRAGKGGAGISSRFRPWRRGAAAAAGQKSSRGHPYARGRRQPGRPGQPGGGGYRRQSSGSARKRGPAGRRYQRGPAQNARGRHTRNGPAPGLNARVRRPRWYRKGPFRRTPVVQGTVKGRGQQQTARRRPRWHAVKTAARKVRYRTGRRAGNGTLWLVRRSGASARWLKAKAPKRPLGRIKDSLLKWGRNAQARQGRPVPTYTHKPADSHMPRPAPRARGVPFPSFAGPRSYTSAHRKAGSHMAGLAVENITEDLGRFFSGFDPENIDQLTQVFALKDVFESLKDGVQKLSDKFGEELPVKPEVAEGIGEAVSALAGLQDHFEELEKRFEQLHHDELERLRNPRPQEELWDKSRND